MTNIGVQTNYYVNLSLESIYQKAYNVNTVNMLQETAISDSATTINIIAERTVNQLQLIKFTYKHPITIHFVKGHIVVNEYIKGQGLIKTMAIVPGGTVNLIGVREFVSNRMKVLYSISSVEILNSSDNSIFTGNYNSKTGLYEFDLLPLLTLSNETLPIINPTTSIDGICYAAFPSYDQSLQSRVEYVHKCLLSIPLSTLLYVVKHQFIANLPITIKDLRHYQPDLIDSVKGNGQLQRQNTHRKSSKHPHPIDDITPPHDFPLVVDSDPHTIHVLPSHRTEGILSQDATGALPTVCTSGALYLQIYILNDVVHIETLRSLSAAEQGDALERAISHYLSLKMKITGQTMDGDTSTHVQTICRNRNINIQIIETNMHRQLEAEFAVKITKSMWIAMRAGVHPNYPYKSEWDRLTPTVELMMMLTRRSRKHPTISQFEEVYGHKLDWKITPLHLPGCQVEAFVAKSDRGTWGDHTEHGFVTATNLLYYRAWTVFFPRTNHTRTCASLYWFPHRHQIPPHSIDEQLILTIRNFLETYEAYRSETPTCEPLSPDLITVLGNIGLTAKQRTLTLLPLSQQVSLPSVRTLEPSTIDPTLDYSKSAIQDRERQQLYQSQRLRLSEKTRELKEFIEMTREEHAAAQQREIQHQSREQKLMTAEDSALTNHRYKLRNRLVSYLASTQPSTNATFDDPDGEFYCFKTQKKRKPSTPDEPSHRQIKRDPSDLILWRPSYDAEIGGLVTIGALRQVDEHTAMSSGGEIIPAVIRHKIKRDSTGAITKRKTRFCLDGSVEKKLFGMFTDKLECYSPNIRREVLYLIIAWAVFHRMKLSGFDVGQAFANTPYSRDIPLYTYSDYDEVRIFYLVLGMIYGLPDAGRKWYEWLRKFLEELGYVVSIWDDCLFYKYQPPGMIVLGITTDDSLTATTDNAEGEAVKEELFAAMRAKKWTYTTEDQISEILSIKIDYLPNGSVKLTTPSKLQAFVTHCFPDLTNIPLTFSPWHPKWSEEESDTTELIDCTWMRVAAGLGQYPTGVRHDCKGALSLVSSRVSKAHMLDKELVKHIAAYLYTSPDVGLVFHPSPSPNTQLTVYGANDASFRIQRSTSRSRLGTALKIGTPAVPSGCVDVSSVFEKGTISNSATVAEGKALAANVSSAVVIRGIMGELGDSQQNIPTRLDEDNEALVTVITRLTPHSDLLKHERALIHWLRCYVLDHTIEPRLVRTENQPADTLTKNIGVLRHLHSLPYLLGEQQAIDDLITLYHETRHRKTPLSPSSISTTDETVCSLYSAFITCADIPQHLLHDPCDATLIVARRNSLFNLGLDTNKTQIIVSYHTSQQNFTNHDITTITCVHFNNIHTIEYEHDDTIEHFQSQLATSVVTQPIIPLVNPIEITSPGETNSPGENIENKPTTNTPFQYPSSFRHGIVIHNSRGRGHIERRKLKRRNQQLEATLRQQLLQRKESRETSQ